MIVIKVKYSTVQVFDTPQVVNCFKVGSDAGLWITEELILQHIGKLKDNKAEGTDELGSSFITRLAGSLTLPLMMLFRKSMES